MELDRARATMAELRDEVAHYARAARAPPASPLEHVIIHASPACLSASRAGAVGVGVV